MERARARDQVAMAHIARVRDERHKNPHARRSYELIEKYISENPVQTFGFDRPAHNATLDSLQTLDANAPEASADLVFESASAVTFNQLVSSLANAESSEVIMQIIDGRLNDEAFRTGVERKAGAGPSWMLGRAFGIARAVRMIRDGAPLALLCPVTAWELGE